MRRMLAACSALVLCGWAEPDFDVLPAPPDCRQPALYQGVSIYASRLAWSASRLTATFVLRNVSPYPVTVNGPTPDGLILTEFELISPEGPRYYADWRRIKGVFRRQGFGPLDPNATATSTIEFDAQRRFYTLHFHQQITSGDTKLRRSAFVCAVPAR
jgi:hypothetical protein